mgnify:CR=1 FL=1
MMEFEFFVRVAAYLLAYSAANASTLTAAVITFSHYIQG